MAGQIVGSLLGAVTVGACSNINIPSATSYSSHIQDSNPASINPLLNINCTCGTLIIKARYESIYGCKYNQDIKCGKCGQWLGGHKYVYYCSTHDLIKYPNGYTLCNSCIKSIQLKKNKQQRLQRLQQENNKLYTEIEHKLDTKQCKKSYIYSEQISDKIEEEKEKFMSSFKSGYMMKRGAYHTGWKMRYFELNGVLKTLTYYIESNKSNGTKYKMQGFIDFKKYPICRMMKSKREQQFHVVTNKREWIFKCKDKNERDQWYNDIKKLCGQKCLAYN
eukprot:388456_1